MEVALAFVLATAVGLVLLWYASRSAITVFVGSVENGKLTVTRGKIAPRVLGDLRDVVKRPRVPRGKIRIVRAKDRARVELSGDFTDAQQQQLRNIVGNVPLAQLKR